MQPDAQEFERYWAASELTQATQRRYVVALSEAAFAAFAGSAVDPLAGNAAPALVDTTPVDPLQDVFVARRSRREFSGEALSAQSIDALGCSLRNGAARLYASAGSLNAVEIFFVMFRTSHVLNGFVSRLVNVHDSVAFEPVAPAPGWEACGTGFGVASQSDAPALAIVFAFDPDRLSAKYGERAGRFALIEVGHASQNASLRAACDRLAAYEVGGYLDDEMLPSLGVGGDAFGESLKVGTVLLVGHRVPEGEPVSARSEVRVRSTGNAGLVSTVRRMLKGKLTG